MQRNTHNVKYVDVGVEIGHYLIDMLAYHVDFLESRTPYVPGNPVTTRAASLRTGLIMLCIYKADV